MEKNKRQILLMIITLLISTIIFTNKVDANTVKSMMALGCNFSHIDESGSFVKLTDNKGQYFWELLGEERWDNTIPTIMWYKTEITEEAKEENLIDAYNEFEKGICPSYAVKPKNGMADHIIFANGKSTPSYIYELDHSRYIIYSYEDKFGIERKIAEGYSSKGAYTFVGPDIEESIYDEIVKHQLNLINNKEYVGLENYFKVDEIYASLLIAGNGSRDSSYSVCKNHTEAWCKENKKFKIYAASSGEGNEKLKTAISNWIDVEKNQEQFSKYNNITEIVNDEQFMNTLEEIKKSIESGKEYNFDNINIDNFINKLKNGRKALEEAFSVDYTDCGYENSKTSITSSITSCLVYSDMLGIRNIVEIANENSNENIMNEGHIISALYSDIHNLLEEMINEKKYSINILNSSEKLPEYTELMYIATAYLKSRAENLGINKDEIESLYMEYSDLVEKNNLDIYPVVDCETLLGEDLINKINSYLNIIKIAVPIILIGLGIVEFTKAIFAGDEDSMKKAQKQFIIRLAIAILIFFTPILVNALLSLANKVWTIISPDACGIFE